MSRAQAITLTGIAIMILVGAGAGVLFVLGQASEPPPRDSAPHEEVAAEPSAPPGPAAIEAVASDRSAVPESEEEEAPPVAGVNVSGRVVDLGGKAVPQIVVAAVDDDGEPAIRTKTDASGSFVLAATGLPCLVAVAEPGWTTIRRGEVTPDSPLAPALVLAAPSFSLAGVVVDPAGEPLAGAQIGIRSSLAGSDGRWNAESGADGSFLLATAPAIPGARLSTRLAEYKPDERTLDLPPPEPLRIVLEPAPPEGPVLTGTVVRADGTPVQNAAVSFGSARTRSNLHGHFRLVCGWFDAATPLVAAARRSSPAILAGYGAQVERDAKELPPVRLVLPAEELKISGRVLTANGASAKGWRVALADPTPLDPGGTSFESAEGQAGFRTELRTDARGGFEFGGLAPRSYTLLVSGRDRAARAEVLLRSDPVAAGTRDVVLNAPDGNPGDRIAGRVLTAAGKPVAGARVGLGRAATRGSSAEYGMQGRFRVVTGVDGRFEIAGAPASLAFLVVAAESFLPARIPLEPGAPRGDLTVRLRDRRELSFDGSRSDPQPDLLRAMAGGLPAAVWLSDTATPRATALLRLEGGLSEEIAVGEDVRELVLYRGCHEIGRVRLALDAEGSTLVVWP